jgi:hypothetical protein
MPISTIGQNGLNAPLSLTTPNLGTPSSLVLTNATGLARAALPTGSVLQVVQSTSSSSIASSAGTFTDTNLSASITPLSASNKILVMVTQSIYVAGGGADNGGVVQILRNATGVFNDGGSNAFYINASGVSQTALTNYVAMNLLDSPSSTSSVTYKTQMKSENGSTITAQINSNTSTITLMEIAA